MPITTTEKSTGQQITVAQINPNNARVLTQIQYNDPITANGEQTINLPMPSQSVKFTVNVDGVALPIECTRFFVGQSDQLVVPVAINTNQFTYTATDTQIPNTNGVLNYNIILVQDNTHWLLGYDHVSGTGAASTIPGGSWYYHGTYNPPANSEITSLPYCLIASASSNPDRILGGIVDTLNSSSTTQARWSVLPVGVINITGLPGQNA